MKLNLDCIRDVLQYCIDNIDFKQDGDSWAETYVNLYMLYNSDLQHIYEQKEIMYAVLKLEECHFIKIWDKFLQNRAYLERCTIEDVTYRGHQFLESIQDPNVWERTKSIAKKVGNHSLNFIEDTAQKVAVEVAKQIVTNMMNSGMPINN